MPPFNTPGILDPSFTKRTANLGPAGSEIFGGKNPPSVNAPWANPIRPINSVWIDPGRQEEQPTGFFGEGPGSAIMQTSGFPGFMFPSWGEQMLPEGGEEPPPMEPSIAGGQQASGAGDDFLGSAIKAGSKLLDALAGHGGGSSQTFFGPDVVQKGMEEQWGFSPEPKFGLNAPEVPGPAYPDVTLSGDKAGPYPFLNPSDLVDFNPTGVLGNSPLFGAEVGPAMGYGAEPAYNLAGNVTNQGAEAGFNLGAGGAATAGSWGNPYAAAGYAAIPALAKMFGGKQGQDLSKFMTNPAMAGPAAAILGGPLGMAAGMSMPFILSGMKLFDVGGPARRRMNDQETLKGIAQRRYANLALSQSRPELLPFIQGALGPWETDSARLAEVQRNNRLPPESYEEIRRVIEGTNQPLSQVQYQPQFLQFDEKGMATNLPAVIASNTNLPPGLSEGEIWRLMTIAAQENQRNQQWAAMQSSGNYGEHGTG